jgi:hypothetical protein
MRGGPVTLIEQDYEWPEEEVVEGPSREYTEAEISEALVSRTLTEDQAWYLHVQGVNWQVQVH